MSDEKLGIGILGTAAIARKNIRAIMLARNGLGEPLSRMPSHATGAMICAPPGSPVVHGAKTIFCIAQGPQAAAVNSPENAEKLQQALASASEALLARHLPGGMQRLLLSGADPKKRLHLTSRKSKALRALWHMAAMTRFLMSPASRQCTSRYPPQCTRSGCRRQQPRASMCSWRSPSQW